MLNYFIFVYVSIIVVLFRGVLCDGFCLFFSIFVSSIAVLGLCAGWIVRIGAREIGIGVGFGFGCVTWTVGIFGSIFVRFGVLGTRLTIVGRFVTCGSMIFEIIGVWNVVLFVKIKPSKRRCIIIGSHVHYPNYR